MWCSSHHGLPNAATVCDLSWLCQKWTDVFGVVENIDWNFVGWRNCFVVGVTDINNGSHTTTRCPFPLWFILTLTTRGRCRTKRGFGEDYRFFFCVCCFSMMRNNFKWWYCFFMINLCNTDVQLELLYWALQLTRRLSKLFHADLLKKKKKKKKNVVLSHIHFTP